MDTSRDRFEDQPDDGRGWHEPAHLGQDPDAETGFPAATEPEAAGPRAAQRPVPGWGPRGEAAQIFRYQGDTVGAQGWAVQHGWTVTDGSGPGDKVLADLVRTAPVRATRDHRPAGVMRGRYGQLELVAFDVVYASGRHLVPQWAVTAAPVLVPLPAFRLSPARFWQHRTGGLMPLPSEDPEFDARWRLLSAEDAAPVRRLVQDPTVRGLLLGTDDGDEFWSAAGHVAAIRPDGHRAELLEHHARLLTAMLGALTAAF